MIPSKSSAGNATWPSTGIKPYYQDEAVQIFHGDCREIVPTLGRFDLLLTDPPYGIGADAAAAEAAKKRIAAQGRTKAGRGWKYYGETAWDSERPTKATFEAIMGVCDEAVVWGGNYFADYLPPSMGWLVWDKGQRDFSLADGELAWTSYNRALRIADISRSQALQDGKQHPTQKSEELMRWCLLYADRAEGREVQTVLDPFAGSGTTGRACKDLGRKCVMIEREERYCEIAARRMGQEVLPFL